MTTPPPSSVPTIHITHFVSPNHQTQQPLLYTLRSPPILTTRQPSNQSRAFSDPMGSSTSFNVSTSSPTPNLSPSHLDDDPANPTTALLSSSSSSLHRSNSRLLLPSLFLTTFIAAVSAAVFAFLLFSSSSSSSSPHHHSTSSSFSLSQSPPPLVPRGRPLAKLPRPVVILISSDGFRFGYQYKTPSPNIHRLIANGTAAAAGLIPVFPTLTFPNHYSIATGLYPPHHGIINNHFLDPATGDAFTMASHDPKWWLGEPIWATLANHGLRAATYFWPGSEVHHAKWNCPPQFCKQYNGTVPFEDRVDTVLSYFDLPAADIPLLMTLYFEDPDHQGHQFGPDDPAITAAVARIDDMIGRLIAGLEKKGVFEDVSIILLGDHGMVATCDKKLIFLDDLSPWIKIPSDWIQSYTPLLAIRPPPNVSLTEVVAQMNQGLNSGKVKNGEQLKMFLKEDLPDRLHYSASSRIPPIIGLLGEGYKVEQKKSKRMECGGSHGYDNAFFSMRSIFIAHGPQFERGREVPSFENIEIYNIIISILKIKGAANNGSASFPDSILLPSV